MNDEQEDPVAKGILALPDDKAVCYLELSDDAFLKAQKRKLLGNPPSSPDQHTIGDEIIWELLLAKFREDLIIVTRDKTYEENLPLLKKEYKQETGFNLLLVTEKLSEAVERIGKEPTLELIEAEKKEEESVADPFAGGPWLSRVFSWRSYSPEEC